MTFHKIITGIFDKFYKKYDKIVTFKTNNAKFAHKVIIK